MEREGKAGTAAESVACIHRGAKLRTVNTVLVTLRTSGASACGNLKIAASGNSPDKSF